LSATAKLRNIGPKSAAWLRQVGLHSLQDLRDADAVCVCNALRGVLAAQVVWPG